MSDLIRREDAVKAFCMNCKGQPTPCEHEATCGTMNVLRYVASAERKGEWILESGKIASFWVCSECDFPATVADEINDIKYFNYCPNCGARMKGADDETD